jgi:uncharacterized protein (TIGR02001 family)
MTTHVRARWRTPGCVLGWTLATWPAAGWAQDTYGGHVAATTDYVLRGVSHTRGAPALQADLHYTTANGWFAGAWASTVDLNPGAGATLELNAYAGRSWAVSESWNARLAAVHYAYPNDNASLSYDYDELTASLAFRDRLSASIAWSPNTSRYSRYFVASERTALTYDLVGQWLLHGALSANGGIGYYDLDDLYDTGYGYWSAGLAWNLPHLQFNLGYYASAATAEELFGSESTGTRWALTVTWQFQRTR